MLNAAAARAKLNHKIDDIKSSEEFKYIMKEMEKDINLAIAHGESKIEKTFYGMEDQYHKYPSRAMIDAVASELRANGYEYWEFNPRALNENNNTWYGIRW